MTIDIFDNQSNQRYLFQRYFDPNRSVLMIRQDSLAILVGKGKN